MWTASTAAAEAKQEARAPTGPESDFDAIQVSKGFVVGLQGQVLKLELNQQHMITQLERSKMVIDEEHDRSIMYRGKYEEAERQLEITKSELSKMGSLLIEERKYLDEAREYSHTLSLENRRLKLIIEELEEIQSETRTHTYGSSHHPIQTMSPVSVPSSPREHQQGNSNTPRLSPETPEATTPVAGATQTSFQYQCSPAMASGDGLYSYAPRLACGPRHDNDEHLYHAQSNDSPRSAELDDVDWEQREREDWTNSIRLKLRQGYRA